MTTEQREAIDRLNEDKNRPLACGDITIVNVEDIDTVLSVLKEKDAEIEEKDKQIDLIIDEFYKKAKISTKCYLQESVEECMKYKNCKECLKQYFANKVNSSEQ